ncbi:16S rRNA (cytidine1402-2'-O)-methyltransferase [Loktanella sp. PT4BL]|jgi:16S rRNA (cytidine1402-2'-O)-methyltransferase|uniref:16S rRNA (cytidine(1402)-2'-O)-methyltransferase n=1 Tax=Loktanella sp. PT4BL TaxID=2135611 RepID=UPI000D76D48E|nr:16S rRNA (cytidine(1402)-2'-O)-methyltransferase [Loktanella sp. PT4BL]PXW68768.1 16S rRNA (cytidine1402-2'-O)-methyltransferase [Loktanella sp. PT4BL]
MNFISKPLSAGLYFVATPIGSARDITLRALDILASADLIAAEDTRTARKLMEIHGVPLNGRKVVAFHDHSGEGAVARLVADMKSGKSVAYVSEAGTPLVADPGYELGRAAIKEGVEVTTAPGASAVLAALTVSGLATDRFAFVGFLPAAKKQRETEIAALRDIPFTLVFYESPKRVGEMLANLRDILGDEREAVVCRELTKKFEEITRGSLATLADDFAERSVKGELVVLVGRAGAVEVADDDIDGALREAMKTMRVKDAATVVAGALGLPRRQVYQIALQLGDEE